MVLAIAGEDHVIRATGGDVVIARAALDRIPPGVADKGVVNVVGPADELQAVGFVQVEVAELGHHVGRQADQFLRARIVQTGEVGQRVKAGVVQREEEQVLLCFAYVDALTRHVGREGVPGDGRGVVGPRGPEHIGQGGQGAAGAAFAVVQHHAGYFAECVFKELHRHKGRVGPGDDPGVQRGVADSDATALPGHQEPDQPLIGQGAVGVGDDRVGNDFKTGADNRDLVIRRILGEADERVEVRRENGDVKQHKRICVEAGQMPELVDVPAVAVRVDQRGRRRGGDGRIVDDRGTLGVAQARQQFGVEGEDVGVVEDGEVREALGRRKILCAELQQALRLARLQGQGMGHRDLVAEDRGFRGPKRAVAIVYRQGGVAAIGVRVIGDIAGVGGIQHGVAAGGGGELQRAVGPAVHQRFHGDRDGLIGGVGEAFEEPRKSAGVADPHRPADRDAVDQHRGGVDLAPALIDRGVLRVHAGAVHQDDEAAVDGVV